MSGGGHRQSGLSKSVWSDADFDEMGWHDATVHGLCVRRSDPDVLRDLLFDLDYIVRWVQPVPPERYFSFWISPVTLVFEEVWDLQGELGFAGTAPDLEIDALHRLTPEDNRPEWPLWHLEGHLFDLRFRAAGFHQYFRQAPRLVQHRTLSPADRGGCVFDEAAFG